jgi:hypothetical protein
MRSVTSSLSLFLTGAILALTLAVLALDRPEYCGQPKAARSRVNVATAAGVHWPTLAPPQKTVVVRVEADRSDLEIGWVEN